MEIIVGVIGVFIAWLTYHKTFNSTPDITEERNNLLSVFKSTQNLHLEMQTLLQKYIDDNNGANHELYPNITFQQFLNVAKEEFEKGLSDKVYDKLRDDEDFTKSNIATFLDMIQTQNNALVQFKTQLLFLNKA